MLLIIYFIIAFLATTFGALAGLGGGIIIKPSLDFLNHYDIGTSNVLSSFTVLSMAVVSTIKQLKAGVKFQGLTSVLLGIGSIVGGIYGQIIFTWYKNVISSDLVFKNVQSIILGLILILILYITNSKKFFEKLNIKDKWIIIIIGFILGLIAAFLGIGGGPLNVAVLSIFFAMEPKIAASHSILIILFSQMSNLLSIGMSTGFSMYNLRVLYAMIGGGILGGFVGAFLNRKLQNKTIKHIFNILLICLILLNFYNCFRTLL